MPYKICSITRQSFPAASGSYELTRLEVLFRKLRRELVAALLRLVLAFAELQKENEKADRMIKGVRS